jgi:hypothetical protein
MLPFLKIIAILINQCWGIRFTVAVQKIDE